MLVGDKYPGNRAAPACFWGCRCWSPWVAKGSSNYEQGGGGCNRTAWGGGCLHLR